MPYPVTHYSSSYVCSREIVAYQNMYIKVLTEAFLVISQTGGTKFLSKMKLDKCWYNYEIVCNNQDE